MTMYKLEFLGNLWKSSLKIWVSAALQPFEIDLCNPIGFVHSQREYVSGLCHQFDSFEAGARKMSQIVCEFFEGDTGSGKTKSD